MAANITQNFTNATWSPIVHFFPEPLGMMIFRYILEVGIAAIGLLGNLLVIIVIASKRLRGRSFMHSFIMNLALADIGVLVIIFPLAVIKERLPFLWPLGEIACLYVVPWVDTFYGASIWFITSIAFQRYINIVRAAEHLHHQTSKHFHFYVIGIWLTCFAVVSLPLFFLMKFLTVGEYQICIVNWSKVHGLESAYTVFLVVFTYVLPLFVISWTYIGIWREIRKSTLWHQSQSKIRSQSQSSSSDPKNTEQQRMKENARAKKILTPIVLTFAICMLPVNIFRIWTCFFPSVLEMYHFWTLYNTVVVITITNSAINPLIYSIVSQDFRRAFTIMIFKVVHKNKGSMYTQVTRTNGHSQHGSRRGSHPESHIHRDTKEKVALKRNSINFTVKTWPEPKLLKESII